MSDATSIQWTDATWNPTRGCARVSAGCENCYAERLAHRFSGPGGKFEGLTRRYISGPKWTGKVRRVPELIDQPLRWRKPRRVFVNSMSDLFHEDVPDAFIDRVFAVMACAPHTFQILTKRPDRMHAYLREHAAGGRHVWVAAQSVKMPRGKHKPDRGWPLPNVWLGVSCEDQAAADERIPLLLQTPAAVRFVSCEPLLERVTLFNLRDGSWHDCEGAEWYNALEGHAYWSDPADGGLGGGPRLDWVIVGGESGPRSRDCDVEWVRSIVNQCQDAKVPVFVKQLGQRCWVDVVDGAGELRGSCDEEVSSWFGGAAVRWEDYAEGWYVRFRKRSGSDPSEWPEELRVREFPR